MEKLFIVGDIIYGFCNGYFGRDDYNTKVCILVTPRYAVFQYLDGEYKGDGVVLSLRDGVDKETANQWKIEN